MIAIYSLDGKTIINLVTLEEWLNMTNSSLQGNQSEYVTASLVN